MKQQRSVIVHIVAAVLALMVSGVTAAENATLTRAQWLKKVGASVTQESVLRETLSQVSPDERVEFAQRVIKAVKRLPVSPDEKVAIFVRTSVACIASSSGDLKYKVIAEVFAGVPVEFLPVVTEELAKRFNQEYNGLSDAAYEKIACEAVKVAILRNAQTDEPSVRNTFVLLAFLRGAKNPKLEDVLLSLLTDDRMRKVVSTWLIAALNDKNYDGLLAAADVEPLVLTGEQLLQLTGHDLDRLLADLNAGRPFSFVTGAGEVQSLPSDTLNQPTDFNINRIPRTYQNQSSNINGGCCPCPCIVNPSAK